MPVVASRFGVLRLLRAIGEGWPWLRPLLPAAVLAASWPGCRAGEGPLVAFLGDSLTSGWRLREAEAFPAQLGRLLAERGRPIRVLNAGVSGDTVAMAAARLPDVLREGPDVLVVALGVNDGLLGLPLDEAEHGLRGILDAARDARVPVLLVGVALPPGTEWTSTGERARLFADLHPRLAADYRVALVPDLLAGVAGDRTLLFPDLLHPTAAGHRRLAENVRPQLELVLAQVDGARSRGGAR